MPADPRRGRNNPPGSKREAARQRVAEKRAVEAAARVRAAGRRRALLGGAAAGVVLVIAVAVVLIQSHRTSTAPNAAAPAHTVDHGLVIPVGSAAPGSGPKPVVIDLYEDLQCPNCKAFEAKSRGTLAQLVAQGRAVLHYHEMAFLDSGANDDFSTRALNAAAVVTDVAGDQAFQTFHDLVYDHQTPESGPGMTDQQLIAYAAQAGATGPAVSAAITNLKYGDWTRKVTDQASQNGVTRTPTVIIGGQRLTDLTPAGVTAAVSAAANS